MGYQWKKDITSVTVKQCRPVLSRMARQSPLIVDHYDAADMAWLAERSTRDTGLGGKMVMRMLGFPNDSRPRDLHDGDIKAFTVDENGVPCESMFITCSRESVITDLIEEDRSFMDSHVFWKIQHMLLVGIQKDDPQDPCTWRIAVITVVFLDEPRFAPVLEELALGYENMKHEVQAMRSQGEHLHTTTGGQTYAMQLRPHDSGKKHPMYDGDTLLAPQTYGPMIPKPWVHQMVMFAKKAASGHAPRNFPAADMPYPKKRLGRGTLLRLPQWGCPACYASGKWLGAYVMLNPHVAAASDEPEYQCPACKRITSSPEDDCCIRLSHDDFVLVT